MILILKRYIAKHIVIATGLVTFVITGVLFLMGMLSELRNIGEGDYGMLMAIFFVLMRLPNQLYQYSPVLLLLGCTIGLSMLSSHRELIVMRSSGFAVRQIIGSVIVTAFFLMMVFSIIGECLTPYLSYQAEVHKEMAQNGGQAVVLGSGVWLHIDNNFIHAQEVVSRNRLHDVTRYEFDEAHRLKATYFAKFLLFQNHNWQTYEVVKTNFFNQKNKEHTFSQYFPSMTWRLKFNPNLLNLGLVDPSEMPLPKLMQYVRYLESNKLQSNEYQYEFWRRILQPIAAMLMIFLSVPFVLETLRGTSLGKRILIGILIGFIFFISNAFLGQMSIVYQLPGYLAAMIPLFAFSIVGCVLLKRVVRN